MSRGTPAADAYLDLKARARREKRPTQELLELYLLEGFLAAVIDFADPVLSGDVRVGAWDVGETAWYA